MPDGVEHRLHVALRNQLDDLNMLSIAIKHRHTEDTVAESPTHGKATSHHSSRLRSRLTGSRHAIVGLDALREANHTTGMALLQLGLQEHRDGASHRPPTTSWNQLMNNRLLTSSNR